MLEKTKCNYLWRKDTAVLLTKTLLQSHYNMNMSVYIGVRVINWVIPVNASDWLSEIRMKRWTKEVKRKPDTFQCYANKDGPRPSAPLAQRCRKARFSQTRRFLSKQHIHWLFSSAWPALKAMLTPRTPLSSRRMWGFKVFRKEKKRVASKCAARRLWEKFVGWY